MFEHVVLATFGPMCCWSSDDRFHMSDAMSPLDQKLFSGAFDIQHGALILERWSVPKILTYLSLFSTILDPVGDPRTPHVQFNSPSEQGGGRVNHHFWGSLAIFGSFWACPDVNHPKHA